MEISKINKLEALAARAADFMEKNSNGDTQETLSPETKAAFDLLSIFFEERYHKKLMDFLQECLHGESIVVNGKETSLKNCKKEIKEKLKLGTSGGKQKKEEGGPEKVSFEWFFNEITGNTESSNGLRSISFDRDRKRSSGPTRRPSHK
ncbi:hypothetical protein KJ641_02670 [Patescibacteria group bacterium]|nr:hypothetical protein [Patescibacteria group bacterium]MBU1895748.1 hypothetical protein [Patescibacteria group bacterium]